MKKKFVGIIMTFVIIVGLIPTIALSASGSDIAARAAYYDGVSRSTYDCSAYTQKVYADCGISIPRMSQDQSTCGTRIYSNNLSDLKAGDIICFGSSSDANSITHVGIYDGNGGVWHSSYTYWKIRKDSLSAWMNSSEYTPPYQFAVRVIPDTNPNPPSNAWMTSSYAVASSYDNLTLKWGADNATAYWMHIYKDGEDFINQSVGSSTSLTRTFPAGNYTAYIEASNSMGNILANVSFSITNSAPDKVIVYSDYKIYGINEKVTLRWNEVNNANSYLIHIWTSTEDFLCQEVTGTSFELNNLHEEMYTVYVTTYNSNGSTTSAPYDFWVTDDMPDKVMVSSDKKIYKSGESVVLSWNTVNNANSYLIHIWTSTDDFLCKEVESNILCLNNLKEEMYTVYVTTYNPNGSTTSSPYDFWVDNSPSDNSIIEPIGDYTDKILIKKTVNNNATFAITPLNGSDLSEIKLFVAEYSETGSLKNVKLGTNSIVNDSLFITVDLPTSNNYKFMLWDKNQKPLVDAITNIQ